MLRPFCTPYCMLVDVVACCCAKFETGKTFQPRTPNISFAQLFEHCWGHARSLRMVYKNLWVLSFPRCTAGPHIVGATMLGVVASVCTQPKAKLTRRASALQNLIDMDFKIQRRYSNENVT